MNELRLPITLIKKLQCNLLLLKKNRHKTDSLYLFALTVYDFKSPEYPINRLLWE